MSGVGGIEGIVSGGSDEPDPQKLRELAAWYQQFAERAGSIVISESRLRMADELEREADRLDQGLEAG